MELPSETIGPYRLLRPIARGGIGRVFAAVHQHMHQEVALKLLSLESAGDPQMVARFFQESRALSQLQHPGIVRVHNCDTREDGTPYLVMEYLEGPTLRTWIQRQNGPAPLGAALAICRHIADAMVEVHAKGIVHRDLKPENVILVQDEAAPLGLQPKVVDFGIAKMPAPTCEDRADTHVRTAAYNILGTSAYMAPEQWKNPTAVTDRADVYALGVVLFELIAGRPPFVEKDDVALLYGHVYAEPRHLRELVPTVPPALSTFVASMLAKVPEQRPAMSRCQDMLARPWESEKDECPFPGLQPFTEAQAELFFGRDVEIRKLLADLEEMREGGTRRWLQIDGPSGSGKSSLVQAGILPRLAERSPGAAPWLVATLRPSEDPIKSLAAAVLAACSAHGLASPPAEVDSMLRSDADALDALLSRHVPANVRLLLVVEQLEELFALGDGHLHQFDALLSRCLSNEHSPLRLLTTLRSDYSHRMRQAPGLARLLDQKALRHGLRPMDEEALAEVIFGMAARAGIQLDDDLPERMVRDAAGTDGRLPLLGHTLRSLYSSRSAAALTHDDYEKIGGVSGALARHAALLLDDLGEAGRERAKWLLLDLVQVGRNTPDTRRSRTRGEVLAAAGGDRLADEVLMRLSGMSTAQSGHSTEGSENLRLVVMVGDPPADPSQQRVDLVHETLLQRVPVIVGWIEAERALLERHADLEGAARAWEQSGTPEDGLPAGSLLDHYRGKIGAVHQRERLLRMASERARRFLGKAERLERRRSWVMRALTVILGAAVIAISATALWAWREREHADEERRRAEAALEHAERERERAEANRQHIIMAIKKVVGDLDWKHGRLLYTSSIRAKLLEHLDDNLSSLREEEKDKPDVIQSVVDVKHRRSDFSRSYAQLSQSYAFVSQAASRIRFGLERDPSNDELLLKLAWNHSKRGKLELAYGRYELAREAFARSVTSLMAMPPRAAETSNYKRTLATSYSEQADVELELGHARAAAARYQDAIRSFQEIDEPEGEGERYNRALIALSSSARGEALRRSGDLRAAATTIEQARQSAEEVVQAEPWNAYYHWILGKTQVALAAVRVEERQTAAASRLYEEAASTGEALHLGDPTHKEYGLLLCQSLRGVEALAMSPGGRERAAQAHERRCEITHGFVVRDPEDVRFTRLACPPSEKK
ncbi:serine/threonine-protein kinase [Sorangium sp. So ce216]